MAMRMYWTPVKVHRTSRSGEFASEVFQKPSEWAKFVFCNENRDSSGNVVSAEIVWIDEDVRGSRTA